jgi:hypothetical protein
LVLTLRFARCSYGHGPWLEFCLRWSMLFPLERCSSWHNPRKWHNTYKHLESRCNHTYKNHGATLKSEVLEDERVDFIHHWHFYDHEQNRMCSITTEQGREFKTSGLSWQLFLAIYRPKQINSYTANIHFAYRISLKSEVEQCVNTQLIPHETTLANLTLKNCPSQRYFRYGPTYFFNSRILSQVIQYDNRLRMSAGFCNLFKSI